MRMVRILTTAILSAGTISALVVPAQAAPAAPTPARYCVVNLATESVTCTQTADEMRRIASAVASVNLVEFWTGYNYTGNGVIIRGSRACTEQTIDIDVPWSRIPLYPGQISSVVKYPASNCNWQLRGPNGGTSTWVEGSRADLRALGDGWDNRAVDFRLT